MRKISYILTLIITSFLISFSALASDFMQPMSGRIVSDYAGVFSSAQLADLENTLRVFNDTSSTQIAVLTVKDLNGYAASEYAIQTAEEWGVGQKNKDNGVLVLVKPKNDTKGEVFIAVGYGLEGVIPDALAKRIVSQVMIPNFMQNDYYSGVKGAVVHLMKLSSGEYTADSMNKGLDPMTLGMLIFFGIIFLVSMFSKQDSTTIGNDDYNRHHRGGGPIFFGGMSRGGGGSSFGGGGFGGFGGGGFGGGGAGGSW
ncbi:MAG: TPM domain-containing protein [Rikenellaceae bacterium]